MVHLEVAVKRRALPAFEDAPTWQRATIGRGGSERCCRLGRSIRARLALPEDPTLDEVFAETVTYVMSPWTMPVVGLPALRRFWEAARSGPDEGFRMTSEIVALDGSTAVVRVFVDYDDGQRWRDLWVVTLDGRGRCERFEEWPFAPSQDDGHGQERR
jgi:hypothetical protein